MDNSGLKRIKTYTISVYVASTKAGSFDWMWPDELSERVERADACILYIWKTMTGGSREFFYTRNEPLVGFYSLSDGSQKLCTEEGQNWCPKYISRNKTHVRF